MKNKLIALVACLAVIFVISHVAFAYTQVTTANKKCSGGTLIGTQSNGTDQCVPYCTGLGASCCTTSYVNDNGSESYTCSAYSNTTTLVTQSRVIYSCHTIDGETQCFGSSSTANVFTYPAATATLNTSTTSVQTGGSGTLTWSSTNATSCTGTNFSTGNATSGSVVVTPSTTTTYGLSCTGPGGTGTGTNRTITVTGGTVDLTAGTPSTASSLTTGSSVVFSASATNSGAASTATTFSNRFQIDLSADGTYDVTIDATNSSAGLGGGASRTITASAWTAVSGTHKIRMCADIPPANPGSVAESNENNNCGADYTFTITVPNSYTSVNNAQCSGGTTLGSVVYYNEVGSSCLDFCSSLHASCCTDKYYSFSDPMNPEPMGYTTDTCTATTGTGTSYAAPDYHSRPPPGTGYYHEWATTYSATLITYGNNVTASLAANPTSVSPGHSSLLTWSSTGATSCTGTNFSTGNATSGSVIVAPNTTTTYTVTCTNGTTNANNSKTVTVQNLLTVSCTASPSPSTVFQNTLWSSSVSGGGGHYEYSWSGDDSLSGTDSSVTKAYATTGTKTATLSVTDGLSSVSTACNNAVCQQASCTCTGPGCGVVVNEGNSPDLSAGTPSLASGLNQSGSTVTFSANVTNIGNKTVNAAFRNRFQIDIGNDGTWDVNLDAPAPAGTAQFVQSPYQCSSGTLVASSYDVDDTGSSFNAAAALAACPFTDTTAGAQCCSMYVRIKQPSQPNSYYQSDVYQVGTTASHSATCKVGDTNCYWGAATYVATTTSYAIGLNGSQSVTSPVWSNIPAGTHAIRFCSDLPDNSVAETNENNNCGASLIFAVTSSAPITVSITASAPRVKAGSPVVITWNGSTATSCTVSGPGLSAATITGSQSVTITADSTYTLTCNKGGSISTASANVKLTPSFIEF